MVDLYFFNDFNTLEMFYESILMETPNFS